MKRIVYFFIVLLIFASFNKTFAQEDDAKKAQNPLADIISVPFQSNTDFGLGEYNRNSNVLNIQPILPVKLGEWLLINRFIIPAPITVPDVAMESGSTTGLGDTNYTAWFSPPIKGALTLGFGFVTIWPTAGDDILGSGKFSIGPSMVLVYANPKWVGAAVISDWKSVAGDENRADIHTFYFQYIFSYFLPNKWYLTTGPVNTANWEADSDNRWTIPIGGGFGKMFQIGKLPMDLQAQFFYYVIKPEGGADYQLRVQLKLIF